MTLADLAPKARIFHGETWKPPSEYHASPRLSRSRLVQILRSPRHFACYEPEEARALVRGDAIHAAVLEPERFEREYVYPPTGIDRRTKEGKAEWAAFLDENEGRKVIVGWDGRALWNDDVDTVEAIRVNVGQNPALERILRGPGMTEATIEWERDGVELRCRPDRIISTETGWDVVDLKSARDIEPQGFAAAIAKHHYHFQASMYLDGVRAALGAAGPELRWKFVAYETSPPYAARVYTLGERSLDEGKMLFLRALRIYRECMASGAWVDRSAEEQTLEMAEWAFERLPAQKLTLGGAALEV